LEFRRVLFRSPRRARRPAEAARFERVGERVEHDGAARAREVAHDGHDLVMRRGVRLATAGLDARGLMDRHLRRGPWRAMLAAPTTAATPAAPAAALALGTIA